MFKRIFGRERVHLTSSTFDLTVLLDLLDVLDAMRHQREVNCTDRGSEYKHYVMLDNFEFHPHR
jgi:hypothetical protein